MRSLRPSSASRLHDLLIILRKPFARYGRRALCFMVIFGLLTVPNAGYAVSAATDLVVAIAKETVSPISDTVSWVKRFLRHSSARPRPDTLADRLAHVASIQITPRRFVGYQGQTVSLTALPLNFNGDLIQGVRFDWESSDTNKVQINDAGTATFLKPGQARIICRAGAVSAFAQVLVRAGTRSLQSDAEWRLDQKSLPLNSTTGLDISGGTRLVAGLLDQLAPTAHAQGGTSYSNSDFLYDELWSEPRNLVGAPRNRLMEGARGATVLPESNNFKLAIPLVNLGGRGLGAGLVLYYNSRVWFRHGNAITFDAIESRPSPGFSLGFGRLVTYGPSNAIKYLWIDPDGTRHYLGQGGNALQDVTLQTNDGSHLTFYGNAGYGGTLYSNDGTKVSISLINNRLLPFQITDSNGNYITITYKTLTCDPGCESCSCPIYFPQLLIDYVTDTMGRIVQCNYDATNNLTSITAPGYGGTAQNPVTSAVAQFDYESRFISSSLFSGLTIENRPTQSMNFLKHVYRPATATGYKFTYSTSSVAYNVSMRRQMSINGSGVISDGTESSSLEFNYQTGSTPALTDAPTFTQRTESAANAPTATYTYANSFNSLLQTKTYTITMPDTSTLNLTRSTNTSSVANGLMVQSEVKTSGGTSMSKSVVTYANDPGGQPQVQSVINYDDATPTPNQTKMDFDYDTYGNLTNTREYGYQISGQWQVRRRLRTIYKTDTSYVNAYLRGLIIETDVYDAQLDTNDANDVLLAKTAFTYDNYAAMSGMEEYRNGQGQLPTPPGHLSNYDATVTVRGNVTGTTQWYDLANNLSYTRLHKIDMFGNTIKEQMPCCNEQSTMLTQNCYWAIAEEVRKGAGGGVQLIRSGSPDFNTGVIKDSTDPRGQTRTVTTRDAALRPTQIDDAMGVTQTRVYNDNTLSISGSKTYDDNGTQKTVSESVEYDGWGRVIEQVDAIGAQVNTTYDSMGRVASVTNPFTAGGSPSYSTTFTYDVLGRATLVTFPDSQTTQTSYNGNSVTITDQVNRKIQRLTDGLGRLVTVNEQDVTGALSQATSYSYNTLDSLTQVNQGNQLRSYKYDALSRLVYEKIPEQTASINDGTGTLWTGKYTYTDSSAIATRTDARGVVATFSYDSLNRISQVAYNTVSGVTTAPTVSYIYDQDSGTGYNTTAAGMLLRVNVGTDYKERYTVDNKYRIASTVRTIGTTSYTNSYGYNEASQITQLTYASGLALGFTYNANGGLSGLKNATTQANFLSNVSYNLFGGVTADTLGSSVTEQFGYDAARMQLTSQKAGTTSPYTNRMNLTYGYSAIAGQMGQNTTAGNAGQLTGVSGTINGQTETATYNYDLLGRLSSSSNSSNGSVAGRIYNYDRWGNRLGIVDSSTMSQIQSVTLQLSGGVPTNRITSVTTGGSTGNYTYDASGNLTNDGAHTYTYDSENRLVNVDGTSNQYAYDHKNRRYKKTIGSAVTHYVWEGSQVLSEHYVGTPSSATVQYIYGGSRLIAKMTGTTTNYFLSDRLSVRLMMDTSGGVVGRQAHLPFGEDFAESGTQQKQHFTSYERDAENGLDYAVNRYYSPTVGRFMSADPYKASAQMQDPRSWNRYSYTRNVVTNRTDPLGLTDWGAIGAGLANAFAHLLPAQYMTVNASYGSLDTIAGILSGSATTIRLRNVDGGNGGVSGEPIEPPSEIDPFKPDGDDDCSDFVLYLYDLMKKFKKKTGGMARLAYSLGLTASSYHKSDSTTRFKGELYGRDEKDGDKQGGDMYKHLVAYAGLQLMVNTGGPKAVAAQETINVGMTYDATQVAQGRKESIAELNDDYAGKAVGDLLAKGIFGSMHPADAASEMAKLLCEEHK